MTQPTTSNRDSIFRDTTNGAANGKAHEKDAKDEVELAKLPPNAPGAGPPMTLRQAAKFFYQFNSPWFFTGMASVAVMVRLYAGHWMWKDLLIAGIILAVWPVQEWLIHVFILHLKPFKLFGKRYDSVFGSKHRQHHREPWKPELIFIPSPGRYGATVILPIAWLTFLPFEQGLTGLAVYLVLTLNYEWMHFLCHTSYKPRTWYYRRIWQNHRLHHFRNEKYWYGVSMLSGDYILRTHPDAKSTPLSDTVMTLGVEEHERDELTGTDAAGA